MQKPRMPHGWRDEEYDRAVAEKDLLYPTSRAAQEGGCKVGKTKEATI